MATTRMRLDDFEPVRVELACLGISLAQNDDGMGKYRLTFMGKHEYDATYVATLEEARTVGRMMYSQGHGKWTDRTLRRIFKSRHP